MSEETLQKEVSSEEASETLIEDERTPEQLQEDEARVQGWLPQEEWIKDGKDPVQWRDASTFLSVGSFFSKISSLNKKIDSLEEDKSYSNKIIKQLYEQNKTVQESSYKQAMTDLRKEAREARREEEHDRADALEDQMEELRENKPEFEDLPEEKTKSNQESNAEFYDNWANSTENSWYLKDQILQDSFNGIFQRLSRTNPSSAPEQLLEKATVEIKQIFPDKFRTGAQSPVVGRTGKSGTTKMNKDDKKIDYSREDIGELKAIGKRFVEAGVYDSVEEYLADQQIADDTEKPMYIGKKDDAKKTA